MSDPLALTTMPSRAVAAKALAVPVAIVLDGDYIDGYSVGSGSTPGKTYTVKRHKSDTPGADSWTCSCVGGPGCGHVYAAKAHADPAVRRALQALVRPARRMGREAAERLVTRYAEAVRFCDNWRGESTAKRDALAAKLVARLTGNTDDEEAGA